MTGLGLRLPLIEGEMPTSYVSRLARLHGTEPRDFCSDMGLRWPHICSSHPDQLALLAKLTGASLPDLLLWSGQLLTPCRYTVGHAVASTGVFRRAATRVCPRCVVEAMEQGLQAGPYQLLEWLVLSVNVCSRHLIPLIKLPNAGHTHQTYDFMTQIDQHKAMLLEQARQTERLPLTTFEDYVAQRVRGCAEDNWLSPLELQHLHRACLILGTALNFGAGARCSALGFEDARAATDTGYSVLLGGPSSLVDTLQELKADYKTERPYFSTDFGELYTWLKDELEEPALTGLRRVVRGFIFAHYPVRPDQLILGEKPRMATRVTFDEAKQISGIARGRMIATLVYLRQQAGEEAGSLTDASLAEIKTVEEFWAGLTNLKDAAEVLGVHVTQMKSLIEAGVIDAVRLGTSLRYVTKSSIENVLNTIAAIPVDRASWDLLPIAEFSQGRCVSMALVLKAVLDGTLTSVFRSADGTGIKTLLIDNGEMPLKKRRRLQRDMSIMEAAEHLRIGSASVRELRDCNYLEQIHRRNPDTNHRRAFITRSSVARFETQFETLGQMAERMDIRPIHLAKRLDIDCVEPLPTKTRLVRAYPRVPPNSS